MLNGTLDQAGITFHFSEDGIRLVALCEPPPEKIMLDVNAIKSALVEQCLSELFIDDKAIEQLIRLYSTATEKFSHAIGERRDGECDIKISPDCMTAWLHLTPPMGGLPVSRALLDQQLKQAGIVSGLLDDEIEAALKAGSANGCVIAQGLAPVPGVDAQFESLVPEMKERHPHVDEHGVADYRDLGQVVTVYPGDPLMRRTPPTAGENGQDIMGMAVYPKPGQDIQFVSGLQGAVIDPEDSNLLRAAIIGQPVQETYGVLVEPTLTLSQVDLSTGNVVFDGTVHITGDVKEGMKINATGDVFIEGTVEAADIHAGGNIVITCGVIGHGASVKAGDGAQAHSAKLQCAGSVNVRFAENAMIHSGTDICVEECAMHSMLTADNKIIIGKAGGKKGHLIGGQACAATLVKAGVVGSDVGIKTRVQVGYNPQLYDDVNSVLQQISAKDKEQADIEKIIAFVQAHPEKNKDGLLEKARASLRNLYAEVASLREKHARLDVELGLIESAQVIVEQTLHPGSEIQIGNKFWITHNERGGGVFQLKEGEIDFGSILQDTSV